MKKDLSEMTLEELWELFPIFLTEHQSIWRSWYKEEQSRLQHILPPGQTVRISHMGSTAVKGIWAKPIIDILVELDAGADLQENGLRLQNTGYIQMSSGYRRISFNKGYTPDGFAEKVYHLHLRYQGDNDELYFRDYLNEHPDTARAYEKLKLDLWPRFAHNRDGYTDSKSGFVKLYTAKAREIYGKKYR